jgi:hypothetical protein
MELDPRKSCRYLCEASDGHSRRRAHASRECPAILSISNFKSRFSQFISIHIRHGDFRVYCNDIPEDQCFAPLPVIARRVSEVQQELRERKGIDVTRVIMTSDERDPNWWSEVRNLGWNWIDYAAERTVETHGKWYVIFSSLMMFC